MNSEQIRKEVTERVVKLLESGNISKWIRPWVQFGSPRNLGTGRKYSGLLNIMLLQQVAMDSGFKLPLWATYHQLQNMGANVLKGQRACRVVFWKEYDHNVETAVEETPVQHSDDAAINTRRKHFFLQYFSVFNIEQTTLDADKISAKLGMVVREHTAIESLESFAAKQEILIQHGGDTAFYTPSGDYIQMPVIGAFKSPEDYYSTLFHELVHSTGHPSRLNRIQTGMFGTEAYAREELIAELGSLYLCAELGLEGKLQHAQYLHSYLGFLKANTSEIFKVAGKAKEAVDYLLAKANLLEKDEQIDIAS